MEMTLTPPTIVLVHGFMRKAWDMRFLRRFFTEHGYRVTVPNLPATRGGVDRAVAALQTHLAPLAWGKIHFVGHSTGGRIILKFLTVHAIPGLGNVVLIAAPVQGSRLARCAGLIPGLTKLWRTVSDLCVPVEVVPAGVRIGVIAGGRGTAVGYNPFIPGDNDDLIAVDETRFRGMQNFLLRPYVHQRIHKHADVARNVLFFLEHARFLSEGSRGPYGPV